MAIGKLNYIHIISEGAVNYATTKQFIMMDSSASKP